MTGLSARRRLLIALVVAAVIGYFGIDWAYTHLTLLAEYYRDGSVYCSSTTVGDLVDGCLLTHLNPLLSWAELVVVVVLLAVCVLVLARWVLRPVGAMAEIVHQLGPTSLGMRLRASGPREETRRLADAIDGMLDRLAEGYESQRRFAANASHELRTPLATQRALIEVSLGTALGAQQLELLTRQLLATNERSEALVEGLLALAETERGVIAAGPQRLDAVAADAIGLYRGAAERARVRVEAELEPVEVLGELPLLERLAVNLVLNAVKYNVPDGVIRVTVAAPGVLTVANSGPQVLPEQIPALVEAFHRASGERLSFDGGVGLGLTIARSIVAAHHGSIDARANPTGGMTVSVVFPARAG